MMTFANSLDPDQAWQNVRPDLDPICLPLWWYAQKIFSKKLILKKIKQTEKSMQKYSFLKRLFIIIWGHIWEWNNAMYKLDKPLVVYRSFGNVMKWHF